ncbi:Probable peroxisomal acyl-coenzyme A oxidase 1 [Eumeta japonica]|uniref:Acyl-coenzyme A oxidase n=1 Tax=Eumeta variegata TaxID=151549 RepID=A0A4C1USR8_EUMVA|nr:Probable peroxisomal acyl-coenzyme A oxidase 1 [Eumeta japonica]
MDSLEENINEDLIKERAQCNFDVSELTYFLDDGKENTEQRRKFEKIVFSFKELKDPVSEEYLSHKEKYENAIRKSSLLVKITKENFQDMESEMTEKLGINGILARVAQAVIKDVSPFLLHFGMFVPTIVGQGDAEQLSYWLPRALDMNIIGAYVQTELGHGTYVRGLETTATYDPETEEFVLNSPTLTSYKWWPGGLGCTANHCIVTAQLYTKEQCHGVHNFVVQIRDEETHIPRMGVRVGEIGPKMGFNTADNGFLEFQNYRVPRKAMLMKNAKVLKDGTYVKPTNEKLTYGTMVYVRVSLVSEVALHLAKAATIAIRYSAVRRQSKLKLDEPELQILDYTTQQHKLFICIATSYALDMAGKWLWKTYKKVSRDIGHGKTDSLPELHALACCLKAISTADAAACIEKCRLACGGHGYMSSSNLPLLYGLITATCTYEGDNTVLLLQTASGHYRNSISRSNYIYITAWEAAAVLLCRHPASPTPISIDTAPESSLLMRASPHTEITCERVSFWSQTESIKYNTTLLLSNTRTLLPWYLVKAWDQKENAKDVKTTVSYLHHAYNNRYEKWDNTTENIIIGLQIVAAGKISSSVKSLNKRVEKGLAYEDAWNLTSVQLTRAAEAHCRAVLVSTYWAETQRRTATLSSSLRVVLQTLAELYVVYWALETVGDLLQLLNSTLGAYDGRVYERLMAEALKSPLNAEPVNRTFDTHLKPLMQGKL